MRAFRWPAIILVVGAMVGAAVFDSQSRPEAEEPGLSAGAALPASISDERSSWFCTAGRLEDVHEVVVINPTESTEVVPVTVFGEVNEQGVPPEPAVVELTVPAMSEATQPLSAGIETGSFVAAAVETPAGFVVEHAVFSGSGSDTRPCVDRAAGTWYEPWGATDRGGEMTMVLFNPFPEDAVADLVFATENGVRESLDFVAVVVPGRSVKPLLIGSGVVDVDAVQTPADDDPEAGRITVASRVSTAVNVRSGRLIAERLQTYDGSGERRGMVVGAAAPSIADAWMYPVGTLREGQRSTVVVFNPTEERAEVDVEIISDEENPVEPFRLTVLPGQNQSIELSGESRLEGLSDFAMIVRSVNGVGVVSSRVDAGPPSVGDDSVSGLTSTIGTPVVGDSFVLGIPESEVTSGSQVVIANPGGDAIAVVSVEHVSDGERTVLPGLENLEVGIGRRVVIDLAELEVDSGALVIGSSAPVAVGREVIRPASRTLDVGVPDLEIESIPDPRFS